MATLIPFPQIIYKFEDGAIVPLHFVGHPPLSVGFNYPDQYGLYMTPRKSFLVWHARLFGEADKKTLTGFFTDLEDLIIRVEKHLVLQAESERNYFHLNLKYLREKYTNG